MQRRGIAAVLAALGLYGLAFIYNTSFIVEGKRYFCLFDDAMISMRYAKNFAAGNGLVWNPGEYVEGFTNLLWTLYMSAWHLLPIEPRFMSLPIQLTSLAALIFAAYQAYRIASVVLGSSGWVLAATVMVAFYWSSLVWALLGMEVGIITALVLLVIRWVVEGKADSKHLLAIYLVLGVMTLIRMDTIIFLVSLSGYLAWKQPADRAKHLTLLAGTIAIFIGGQTLWRYSYYGELLPNTYYLKATGFPIVYRVTRGLYQLVHFAHQPGWALFALPIAWNLWRRTAATNLCLLIIAVAFAYSAYVGGDAWEGYGGANRYITPVMPLYFILLFKALRHLWAMLSPHIAFGKRSGWAVPITAFCLLYLTFNTPNFNTWNPTSIEEVLLIADPFSVSHHDTRVEQALWFDRHTRPGARIAVVWAGIAPYFSERQFVDLYGKSDKHVARLDITEIAGSYKGLAFFPGHNKWDYRYSIGQLKPDVVAQLVSQAPKPSDQLANYSPVAMGLETAYLRNNSQYVIRY